MNTPTPTHTLNITREVFLELTKTDNIDSLRNQLQNLAISVADGGTTIAIVNKSGARRTLNATQYLGSGRLASAVTVDGKHITIKTDDGRTVIKWNLQSGTISR